MGEREERRTYSEKRHDSRRAGLSLPIQVGRCGGEWEPFARVGSLETYRWRVVKREGKVEEGKVGWPRSFGSVRRRARRWARVRCEKVHRASFLCVRGDRSVGGGGGWKGVRTYGATARVLFAAIMDNTDVRGSTCLCPLNMRLGFAPWPVPQKCRIASFRSLPVLCELRAEWKRRKEEEREECM